MAGRLPRIPGRQTPWPFGSRSSTSSRPTGSSGPTTGSGSYISPASAVSHPGMKTSSSSGARYKSRSSTSSPTNTTFQGRKSPLCSPARPPTALLNSGTACSQAARGCSTWTRSARPSWHWRSTRQAPSHPGRPCYDRPRPPDRRPPAPRADEDVRPSDPDPARFRAPSRRRCHQAVRPRSCDDGQRAGSQEGERGWTVTTQFLAPKDHHRHLRETGSGPVLVETGSGPVLVKQVIHWWGLRRNHT